jgi:hypothetical protein
LGNTGTGGELTASLNIKITVASVNDAPRIVSPRNVISVNEDSLKSIDLHVDSISSQTIQLVLEASHGLLLCNSAAPANVSLRSPTNSSLIIMGTVDAVNELLRFIEYKSFLHYFGVDQVMVACSPGLAGEFTPSNSTVNIQILPVNDPPKLHIPNHKLATKEDIMLQVPGVQISDNDADKASIMMLLLSTIHGDLSFSAHSQVLITASSQAHEWQLRGSMAAINSALGNLQYTPPSNFHGNDLITLLVDDNGNFGSGGNLSAAASFSVAVTPVNDVPSITVPQQGGFTVQADQDTHLPGFSISDPDLPEFSSLLVRLQTSYGVLRLQQLDNLQIISGDAVKGSKEISFVASLASINSAIATLHILGSKMEKNSPSIDQGGHMMGSNDWQEISITVSDSATDKNETVEISESFWTFVKPVLSLPSIVAPGELLVDVGSEFAFAASLQDFTNREHIDQYVRVAISAENGLVAISSGLVAMMSPRFSKGQGTASSVLEFDASITGANLLLGSMVYTADQSSESDVISIQVDDVASNSAKAISKKISVGFVHPTKEFGISVEQLDGIEDKEVRLGVTIASVASDSAVLKVSFQAQFGFVVIDQVNEKVRLSSWQDTQLIRIRGSEKHNRNEVQIVSVVDGGKHEIQTITVASPSGSKFDTASINIALTRGCHI